MVGKQNYGYLNRTITLNVQILYNTNIRERLSSYQHRLQDSEDLWTRIETHVLNLKYFYIKIKMFAQKPSFFLKTFILLFLEGYTKMNDF